MLRNIFFTHTEGPLQSLSSSATDISRKHFIKNLKQGSFLSYLTTHRSRLPRKNVSIFKTGSQPYMQCRYLTVSHPYSVAILQCRNLSVPQPYSVATLQCRNLTCSVATLQCRNLTVSQLFSVATLQCCNLTVLQPFSVAILLTHKYFCLARDINILIL